MTEVVKRELSEYSDEELSMELCKSIERHDRLVDSAPMGDERIYFAGKQCDAIIAEQNLRGYKPCQYCNDDGDVHRIDGEWLGYCVCHFGDRLKSRSRKGGS